MSQTCPQCQTEAADEAGFCPSCGASLGGAATATQDAPPASAPATATAAPAGVPASAAGGAGAVPAYHFNAARWTLADRIAGVATIVLFVSLFLAWFGVSVIGITVTASGVSAHGYLYLVMVICILIVAYLALRAGWDELPGGINLPHLTTMMVATLVNLVIVFLGFIFKPGGSGVGWQFGAFLALIAAAVAAAPFAIPQLRAKTMG